MAMTAREKNLALITAVVAVIGLAYIALNLAGGDDIDMSDETTGRFETLFDQMAALDSQKQTNQLLRKRLGGLEGRFITETEVGDLYAAIEKVAGQSGVQVNNYSSLVNRRAKPMPALEANLSIECQFMQLIQFIDNLKNADIAMTPTNLRASLKDPNQPNLQVQLTLSTYLMGARLESGSPSTLQIGGGA